MKYTRLIIVGLAFVFLIYVVFVIFRNAANKKGLITNTNPMQTNQEQTKSRRWETKTDDQGGVAIAVTPLDISPQSKEWKFGISMNTHSVELDQDLVKLAVLVDGRGNEYKPIKWDGPVGGHHREGTLVFNPITPAPKSIELKITGIIDVVRTFSWQIN